MKAIDFVKKYGLGEAKRVLHDSRGCVGVKLYGKYKFSTDDLKKLVDAFELVEWHGGLKYAKSYYERNSKQYPDYYAGWDDLKQAINLMEQCQ